MDSRELSGGFGGLHDFRVLSYHQPRFFMRRLWHSSQRLRDGESGASTKAQPLPRQTFCRPRCLMDPLIRPAREKGVFLELAWKVSIMKEMGNIEKHQELQKCQTCHLRKPTLWSRQSKCSEKNPRRPWDSTRVKPSFLKRGILWSTTLSRQVEAAVQPAARFKILSLECVFLDRVTKRCACLWMCVCNKTGIYRKIIQVKFRNSYSAAVHQIEFTQGNFKRTFQFTAGWRMWDEAGDKLTRRIRELQRIHQNHASMRSILRPS